MKTKYYREKNTLYKINIPFVLRYNVYCDNKLIRTYRLSINMKIVKFINFLIGNTFSFKYNIYDHHITKNFYIEILDEVHCKENMSNLFIIQNYLENKKIKYKINKGWK